MWQIVSSTSPSAVLQVVAIAYKLQGKALLAGDYHANDAVWDAVYKKAPPELKEAMDLAYLHRAKASRRADDA